MRVEPKPGLDTTIFLDVIENGDAMARTKLALQLAGLMCAEDSSKAYVAQVVPVVLKLSVDPEKEVRRTLANGLAGLVNLHADILFSIIADDDDVALPFLAATPALNPWHMLAVLRVGDAARQQTVVLRSDFSSEAMAHVVKSAPLEVCLRLFENPALHLDDRAYHGLYTRFYQVPEMLELLLARPNLPLDIRILQAKRASNRMQQLMAERGWMNDNEACELVADAEETAILRILVEASNDELVTYGFPDSDTLNGYFGGGGGIEWYQPDPHLALALNGGVRKTQGFQRSVSGDSALSLLGSVALRYTF